MPTDNRDIQARRAIESMCLTWRHDYGLNKTSSCSLSSGMTEQEREALRGRMAQLHAHHVAPLEEEILRLRRQLACLQAGNERIEKAASEMGRPVDSAESALDYILTRAQAAGAPLYSHAMGDAAEQYIERCCRSDVTDELLITPPRMPGGFLWCELYTEMLKASGAPAMTVAGWADTKYLNQMEVGDCDGVTVYKARERKAQEPLYRKVDAAQLPSAPDPEREF